MSVYQINYDLRNQRNYEALYERIKSYPSYCHPLESCWIISSRRSAEEVRDHLSQVMDKDDGLLVTKLTGDAAWRNLGDKASRDINVTFDHKAA